ncbi:Guanylate kinase [Frankliniella fusca]|uniref:Guanylate kinase n=1 Tax=Frankliniella fusca TaxID=407009 RepID=A0AAE1LWS3_9NEOP|nr:Guanylate kinase [Frankliniella fusca]
MDARENLRQVSPQNSMSNGIMCLQWLPFWSTETFETLVTVLCSGCSPCLSCHIPSKGPQSKIIKFLLLMSAPIYLGTEGIPQQTVKRMKRHSTKEFTFLRKSYAASGWIEVHQTYHFSPKRSGVFIASPVLR